MSRPGTLVVAMMALGCTGGGDGCREPEPCRVGGTSSSENDFQRCPPEADDVDEVCGKRVVAGEVRVGSTWHPAEHGLVIEAGGGVVLVSPFGLTRSPETVSFLAHCDEGARLFFNDAEVRVSDEAVARRHGPFEVLRPESFTEPTNIASVQGRGSCWIDDLRIVSRVDRCPGSDDWEFDAGQDAGPFDAGQDAGRFDAGRDAGMDGGPVDAGSPDGGDGAVPDASPSDGSTDDAAADAAG